MGEPLPLPPAAVARPAPLLQAVRSRRRAAGPPRPRLGRAGPAHRAVAVGSLAESSAAVAEDVARHRAICRRRPADLGNRPALRLALAALERLRPTASFFDAMDDFPEFYRGLSRRAMRRHEDAIAEKVDLVVASSTFLAEKFAHRGLRVEKVLNGCEGTERQGDKETGRQGDQAASPPLLVSLSPCLPVSRLSPLATRPPVLGYLGCIGHWFDWSLVTRLAEELPQARVELVGPCAVAAAQTSGERAAAAGVPAVGGRPPLGAVLGRADSLPL